MIREKIKVVNAIDNLQKKIEEEGDLREDIEESTRVVRSAVQRYDRVRAILKESKKDSELVGKGVEEAYESYSNMIES
jgi:hypothetical protein